jgi:molecular chaperone GrpE
MSKRAEQREKGAESPLNPETGRDSREDAQTGQDAQNPVEGEISAKRQPGGEAAACPEVPGERGGSTDDSPAPAPEEQIAGLMGKLAELNDQYLRKAADFENYRKRMNQEKQSAIDFANQALLLDLIPVIDDFERAIKAAEDQREAAGEDPEQISAAFHSLREGIGMIEKRLVTDLENKWGLKRYDSVGEPFDPSRHEAIMMEKSAEQSDPVVAEDYIKGYVLKDRVIRPAKVKVIMPA